MAKHGKLMDSTSYDLNPSELSLKDFLKLFVDHHKVSHPWTSFTWRMLGNVTRHGVIWVLKCWQISQELSWPNPVDLAKQNIHVAMGSTDRSPSHHASGRAASFGQGLVQLLPSLQFTWLDLSRFDSVWFGYPVAVRLKPGWNMLEPNVNHVTFWAQMAVEAFGPIVAAAGLPKPEISHGHIATSRKCWNSAGNHSSVNMSKESNSGNVIFEVGALHRVFVWNGLYLHFVSQFAGFSSVRFSFLRFSSLKLRLQWPRARFASTWMPKRAHRRHLRGSSCSLKSYANPRIMLSVASSKLWALILPHDILSKIWHLSSHLMWREEGQDFQACGK